MLCCPSVSACLSMYVSVSAEARLCSRVTAACMWYINVFSSKNK